MAEKKSAFEVLNAINVNEHTETKDTGGTKLTYLSWAWAWAEVQKQFPDATYEIKKFNGIPYVYDALTGFMVYTTVTIEGITREMWLPVMDGNNRAMKAEPYTLTTKYGKEIFVAAATMFDINKTLMRCLTKNLAMFGLGLYIYAGEDLPDGESEAVVTTTTQKKAVKKAGTPVNNGQQTAEPQRSPARQRLKDFCQANNINQPDVVAACGLNAQSTEEDYNRAYEYAKTLTIKATTQTEATTGLPFEV